jgi:alkylation response protein AidB-like acyl-CoA dehydrogenase
MSNSALAADTLRRSVRDFVAAEIDEGLITPVGNSWLVGWDESFTRRLAGQGWVGMTIPPKYGGKGGSFRDRFAVTEELLAAGAPVAAHWIAERQIAPSLLKYGTEAQKRRFLPDIAAGTVFFAIGMSEPDAGSDLASVRTRAERVEGGWLVTGNKVWTSGAHHSHYFIVLARTTATDAEDRHAGLSQFIVDLNGPGVDVRPIISLDGSHHFNEVFLDAAFVADADVFGEIGNGWEQVTSELGYERSGPERYLSTMPLLDALNADGEPDPNVGRFVARLAALHTVSSSVADALADGDNVDLEASMVKVIGTQAEGDIAEVAALRGAGTSGNHRLRSLADAALLDRPGFTLRGGTNEILRGVIARGLGLR